MDMKCCIKSEASVDGGARPDSLGVFPLAILGGLLRPGTESHENGVVKMGLNIYGLGLTGGDRKFWDGAWSFSKVCTSHQSFAGPVPTCHPLVLAVLFPSWR